MQGRAHTCSCTLVIDHHPQDRTGPRTPVATKIAVSQDDHALRLDAFLGNAIRHTLDLCATTALGLGRSDKLTQLVLLIPLITTYLGVPIQHADSLGVDLLGDAFEF